MESYIQFLQSRDLSSATITAYERYVSKFLAWYNADVINCNKKDILNYLAYLKQEKKQANITRKNTLIAINHYFTALRNENLNAHNPTLFIKIRGSHKLHLYPIYSLENLKELIDNFYHKFVRDYDDAHIPKNQRTQSRLSKSRNHVILSMMVYQGLMTSDVEKISLSDLDTIKATLRIKSSTRSAERIMPLHAEQLGVLFNYLQTIRPKLLEYHKDQESDQLILPLPAYSEQKTSNKNLIHLFKPLTKQVKSIDKNFMNFKQVRASMITHWIQTVGLRKAQYLAGHRHITSTEKYLPNDLKSLTDDINKFNPF